MGKFSGCGPTISGLVIVSIQWGGRPHSDDWTEIYCVVCASMHSADVLCRVSDEDKPRLLCCSADCVTLSEPAKAKAGRPCKAPGPPAAQSGTLSKGENIKTSLSQ